MSGPESQKPDDQLLDEWLAGEGAVRAVYRAAASEKAPSALDAVILQAAAQGAVRRPMPRRRARWPVPMATAAVLLLSVGVLLQVQRDPVAQKAVVSAPAAASAPRADALREVPAQEPAPGRETDAFAPPPAAVVRAEKRVAKSAPLPAPPPPAPVAAEPGLKQERESAAVASVEAPAIAMRPAAPLADDSAAQASALAQADTAAQIGQRDRSMAKAAPAARAFAINPSQGAARNAVQAAPAPSAPAACRDFLALLDQKPGQLEYLGCEPEREEAKPGLKARYRVTGAQAAVVEAALKTRFAMPALQYGCCAWASAADGHYPNPDPALPAYEVRMASADTAVNQRELWPQIEFFTVTVSLPIDTR